MNTKNSTPTSNTNRKPKALESAIAMALALTISIPLSAGESKPQEEELEKQYSMQAELDPPKTSPETNYASADPNSADHEGETQYSASDDTLSPHEKNHSDKNAQMKRGDLDDRSSMSAQNESKLKYSHRPVALSNWIGKDIYSADGEKIGEIEDVVVDLSSGKASHALVDNNGLFTGKRLLSASMLQHDAKEGRLVASVNKRDYEAMPEYKKNSGASVQNSSNDSSYQKNQDIAANEAFCKRLVGQEVRSMDGQEIGEINSLVSDPRTAKVFAIIDDIEDDVRMNKEIDQIAVRVSALKLEGPDVIARVSASQISDENTPKQSLDREWNVGDNQDIIILTSKDSYALSE